MAEDFSGLLDELHIKSCNVIGWSDGGNNGLLLAIHHPDKVVNKNCNKSKYLDRLRAFPPVYLLEVPRLQHPASFYNYHKLPQTADLKVKMQQKLEIGLHSKNFKYILLTQLEFNKMSNTCNRRRDHEYNSPYTPLMLIADAIFQNLFILWILPNIFQGIQL